MKHPDLPLYFAVVSHERPAAVIKMAEKLGCEATWYVDTKEEGKEYRKAGAKQVSVSGLVGPTAEVLAKNQALVDAWKLGCACVICADDLRRFSIATERMVPLNVLSAAVLLRGVLDATKDAYLAGGSSNSNPYMTIGLRTSNKLPPNKNPKLVSTDGFILGDFTVVKPCGVYFSENLHVKHDYDYTLKHLAAFGKVVRCNFLLQDFPHKSNKGGANHKRPSGDEHDAAILLEKWKGMVRTNTKRGGWGHEIVIRWKPELREQVQKPRYSRMEAAE